YPAADRRAPRHLHRPRAPVGANRAQPLRSQPGRWGMLMRRPPQTPPTAGNPQTSNAMSATMKDLPRPDPNWNSAMEWLLWIQESPDDEELRAACRAWQQASPAHARAWQRAERVWRLSGQLPRTSHRRWPGMRRRRFAVIGSALAACLALLMVLLP